MTGSMEAAAEMVLVRDEQAGSPWGLEEQEGQRGNNDVIINSVQEQL